MAIMAIGIIGVVRLLPVGLRASKSSEMFSRAAFLAQQKIEELKLAGLAAVVSEPSIPLEGEEDGYSWAAAVSEVSLPGLSSHEDIRQVNLTVSWQEKGQPRLQQFVTYLGK